MMTRLTKILPHWQDLQTEEHLHVVDREVYKDIKTYLESKMVKFWKAMRSTPRSNRLLVMIKETAVMIQISYCLSMKSEA